MKKMSFEEVLTEKKDRVWLVIEPYLSDPEYPKPFKVAKNYEKVRKLHWETVREYPERKGKYVRPTLVLLAAQAMGLPESSALQTAAAMQVSEDWLLIHDDFEDDSDFRRGKPTLHRLYGDKLAVNAGDALHVIMWKILIDNKKILGKDKTLRLMEEFYRMLTRTALGQGVEIMWTRNHKLGWTDDDWFFIADGKTSYYTIATPMRLGAIVADASKEQLELLAEFGKILGRCYQLVDDILDVTSDFRQLKKQIAYNDIYESKKTLILGHLLRCIGGEEKQKIQRILAKPRQDKTVSEVKWIADRLFQRGSIEYGRQIAKKLGEQARKMFEDKLEFLSQEPAKSQIRDCIRFIITRDY